MQITVRLFSIMREQIGSSVLTLDIPATTTAGHIFSLVVADTPHLKRLERSVMVMVNEQYVDPDTTLHEGDEVALIPPVSGGEQDELFVVTPNELHARSVEALVAGPDCGAIVTFVGTVRNVARGRTVTALEYEAYPSAAVKMLRQVAGEASATWPDVRTAIHHRTGRLLPGEASVVIACASPHRDAPYAASAFAIARIKEIVPIWKKEFYEDGSAWVGLEADYQRETGRLPVR